MRTANHDLWAKVRSGVAASLVFGLVATVAPASVGAQGAVKCNGEVATIIGSNDADTLVGTPGRDVIVGLGGADKIDGRGGSDLICGNSGGDIISGGNGADVIFGGKGSDTIRGDKGADVIDGGNGHDTIRGNAGPDTLLGQAGRDTLLGGNGPDELRGHSGADELSGDDGDDLLYGGNGTDVVRGGVGADLVAGGLGIDSLFGGKGPDEIFTGASTGDSVTGGGGDDVINGFPEDQVAQSIGSFSHEDFGGEVWDGEIYGLVSVPVDSFVDEPGDCFLVVGHLVPRAFDGPVVSAFSTPEFGVIAGGEFIQDSTRCERAETEALGYSWVLEAEGTRNTEIPFFAEVFVPRGQGSVSNIVVGNPVRGTSTLFPGVVLDQVPTPIGLNAGVQPNGPRVGSGDQFAYEERFSDSAWVGDIESVESVPVARFIDVPGRCYAILGSLTPTALDGGVVSNPFHTPPIGLLINGRYLSDSAECDSDGVEARGYDWILRAEVTLGTEYRFHSTVFVPDGIVGDPSRVVVGGQSDDAAIYVN